MPYTPIVGSIAEIQTHGVLSAFGSSARNTVTIYHMRLSALVAPATKLALEARHNTIVGLPFLAAANARYTQAGTDIRWVDDATDPPQRFARVGVGAIATDPLPTVDAVYMLLRTSLRGKNFRGSKHYPAASEADTTGDVLTGAGLVRWQTLQTALIAAQVDALGNTWVPSLLSRSLSQLTINPTTVVATDLVTILLNLNIGTMRKRRTLTVR